MKKRLFLFLILPLGLIAEVKSNLYFYLIKLNYHEYQNSITIDRDYSNWGELSGVGYEVKSYFKNGVIGGKIEFAGGNSHYVGATWGGEPVRSSQSGVYILNAAAFIGDEAKFIIGYRAWNRGKGNSEGDYDEIYYWGYYGIGYKGGFGKFQFRFNYYKAVNPRMKAYLGNNPTIDLGSTDGADFEIPVNFDNFFAFYRLEYWHISASKPAPLILNGKTLYIYEPESITLNQYIGIGVRF